MAANTVINLTFEEIIHRQMIERCYCQKVSLECRRLGLNRRWTDLEVIPTMPFQQSWWDDFEFRINPNTDDILDRIALDYGS